MGQTASTPNFRFRRGRFSVRMPTPASTLINIGDLMWSSSGVAYPASSFTWNTDLAGTQPGFKLLFLGVANDNKLVTDPSTRDIEIITEGVFSFDCAALSGAKHVGQRFGPAKDAGGNFLYNQIVATVASYDLAIGLLADEAANGATKVELWIQSYLLNNPLFV